MLYKHGSIGIDVNGTVDIPSNAVCIKHEFVGTPNYVRVSWLVPIYVKDWCD